jgi:hypothetical protein
VPGTNCGDQGRVLKCRRGRCIPALGGEKTRIVAVADGHERAGHRGLYDGSGDCDDRICHDDDEHNDAAARDYTSRQRRVHSPLPLGPVSRPCSTGKRSRWPRGNPRRLPKHRHHHLQDAGLPHRLVPELLT